MHSWGRLAYGILLLVAAANSMPDFSGLPPGPYCAGRYPPGECCPGRRDECSAPIVNTICYCDDFCDRFREEDCCPDFYSHCKGIEANVTLPPPPPPAEIRSCYFQRKYYNASQTFKINCNICKCSTVGRTAEVLCEQNRCLQEPDLINEINSNSWSSSLGPLGWRARNYSEFWGRTLKEGVQLRLGTLNPSRSVYKMNSVRRIYDPATLPREFDARTRWPREISGVEDQGWCGASWAISTARVASDRFAVMSMGAESVLLSAQHLLSCNNRGQQGCSGGYLDRAWMYLRRFGLVEENCYPWRGMDEQCKLRKRTNLKIAGCVPASANPLRTELYKVGPAYRLGNETDIMQEILTSGPVQATMRVYQDFFSYESGVYKHSATAELYETGYHSVRIIGWGEDEQPRFNRVSPLKYWLVVNSWGREWGEDGLFRIERGTNECEIESFVLGVWAKTV
ncbi:tubulointerstitial nephritis antigen-like isoform X2 [Ceratina calcarata]|nr:tubulointerstitial nephritis antigen-like isoform X2 [Ceratina calcarata]XP_017893646.1 tubulointerstitial nephritis antigen-like isoform X2 [Ceratina calcarata]XP_026666864.1 tubulointerstitial nephritis antigen-like isoform X2 [Ceratina calcarata]XP_026666865.1 tubulointerstitial nephritis antigen-like isoform X2 [Ceratina calcarata]XP_026666866.1 tubulointerstitial nephritis antigen-like isoform X2 [Ceratina calcarata]